MLHAAFLAHSTGDNGRGKWLALGLGLGLGVLVLVAVAALVYYLQVKYQVIFIPKGDTHGEW